MDVCNPNSSAIRRAGIQIVPVQQNTDFLFTVAIENCCTLRDECTAKGMFLIFHARNYKKTERILQQPFDF
jgi:hypothetical protein